MSLYRSSEHDINSNFTNFVRKIDQDIIWNFCVIRLLYSVSAHNLKIHFIWLKELSYVDCQNGDQYTIKASQYILRINPLGVVEIIGFRNDAIHEPLPGHQLIFFYDKMWFQICAYLTINELIHWAQCWSVSTRRSKVDHCDIWSFVNCGSQSCHLALFHRRTYTNIANWE